MRHMDRQNEGYAAWDRVEKIRVAGSAGGGVVRPVGKKHKEMARKAQRKLGNDPQNVCPLASKREELPEVLAASQREGRPQKESAPGSEWPTAHGQAYNCEAESLRRTAAAMGNAGMGAGE